MQINHLKRFALFLFLSFPHFFQAQSLDSLIAVTPSLSAQEKAVNYGELCYYYSQWDTDSAIMFGEKALRNAVISEDSAIVALAANDYSFAYLNNGDFKKALTLNNRAFRIRKDLKDTTGMLSSLSKIAISHREMGQTNEALEELFKSLELAKALGSDQKQAIIYDNIGTLYKMQSLFDKAIEYHEKGLELLKNYPGSLELGNAYANIGSLYLKSYQPKEALLYLEKAQIAFTEKGNAQAMASLYVNFGAAYSALDDQEKRFSYANKALDIFTKLGDASGMSTVLYNLHLYHLENRNLKRSKSNALKSLEYALQSGSREVLLDAYKAMTNVYLLEAKPDSSAYFEGLEDSIRSAMTSEELSQSLANAETKYKTAEKEAQIAQQEAALIKADLAVKARTNWILGLSVLILIVAFIAFSVYRQQKLKQERLQAQAKLKAEVAKAEMRARVQEERVRISRDLHDHIGSQLTVITSSIDNLAFRESDAEKKKRFDKISDQTRDTIAQLRETIWAMNNEAIEVEMLVSKLREYTSKISALREEQAGRIEVVSANEAFEKLSPAQTIALFRVAQEAVNNAIKYADFNHLQVSFDKSSDGAQLRMKICDDGSGFNVAEALAKGYGLANMKQRIEDVMGSIRIESSDSKGTSIIIELPLEVHKI